MINDVQSTVIWLTGMSGSGKSTLSDVLEQYFINKQYSVYILDGDAIRDNDSKPLGFGYDDVKINNLRIAERCLELRKKYDAIIVPVISPYESIRKMVREILFPDFYLIYLKTDINSLRERDTKGLYAAADKGIINDLIGYSDINPYDEPNNPDITIKTGNDTSLNASKNQLISFVNKEIVC